MIAAMVAENIVATTVTIDPPIDDSGSVTNAIIAGMNQWLSCDRWTTLPGIALNAVLSMRGPFSKQEENAFALHLLLQLA